MHRRSDTAEISARLTCRCKPAALEIQTFADAHSLPLPHAHPPPHMNVPPAGGSGAGAMMAGASQDPNVKAVRRPPVGPLGARAHG